MTEVLWPLDLCPSSQTWNIIGNAATFTSPLSGATRTYGRPGARMGCTMTFPPMKGQDRARLLAFINTLLDRSNRAWVPDFSTTRRGSFTAPERLTNGDFSNGSTGWSGNAGVSAVSASGRVGYVTLTQNNALNGPAIVNSSALPTMTQYAPHAFRVLMNQGRGNPTVKVARIGTTTGGDEIAAAQSSEYGLLTAAGVPASVAANYVFAGVGPPAGLMAGDGFSTPFMSLSRCALVDGGGNLLLRSDSFDNATWTKTKAAVSANSTTAPDGTTTADALGEDTTTDVHYATQSVTVAPAAADYCLSLAVKASGRSFVILGIREESGSSSVYQYFNLGAGAVGTNGATGANWSSRRAYISPLGDGWYQCTVVGRKTNAATSLTAIVQIALADGTDSYLGASLGIYVWRATLSQSSVPARLIQSDGTAVSPSAQTGTGIYVKGLPASTQGLLEAGDPVQIGGQINFLTARLDSDAAGRGYLQCGRPWLAATNDAPVIVHQPMCKMILATDTLDLDTGPGQFSPFQIELVEAIE